MINLMGSCFDEAYTRYLAKEEQDFKRRLDSEMREENVEIFKEKNSDRQSRERIEQSLAVVRDEGDNVKSRNELFKCIAELNLGLVQLLQSSSNHNVNSSLKKVMADTRDLLHSELKQLKKLPS